MSLFDIFSIRMISYGGDFRNALNFGTLLMFMALFLVSTEFSSFKLRTRMLMCFVLSTLAGIASSVVLSLILVLFNRPLSWYGSPYGALMLYAPPFLLGTTSSLHVLLPRGLDVSLAFDAMLHSMVLVHSTFLAIAPFLSLSAVYFPLMELVPYLVTMVKLVPRSNLILLFTALLSNSVGLVVIFSYGMLCVFQDLLGRPGNLPSDIVCAAAVASLTACYFVPAFAPIMVTHPEQLHFLRRIALYGLGVSFLCAMLYPISVPSDRSAVCSNQHPKRAIIVHFYAPQQTPSPCCSCCYWCGHKTSRVKRYCRRSLQNCTCSRD